MACPLISPAPLPAGLAPVTLLLSILLAAAAVGVGLDVARRVRGAEPALLAPWCLGGALALGTGLWVADAVGRLALQGVWGDLARWAPHPAVVWLAAVLAVLATLAAG